MRRFTAAYVFVFLLGLGWTVSLWLRSNGPLFDDEVGHFLLSRDAFHDLHNLLELWGRPVNTLTYALPALFGLKWARFFSIVLSAVTVLVATRLASELNVRRLYLVPAFLWFQPWFADLGYCVITEVPFSLWLVSGTCFWAMGRLTAASVFFGLLPLTRHEGIALVGLWCAYMAVKREWRAALLGVLPTVLYNLANLAANGSAAYAIYFNSRPTELYGRGDWFHFLPALLYQVGKPVLVLGLIGALSLQTPKGRRRYFLGAVIYFAIHTVIYRFGLYASGGYELFLLPVAPACALAAVLGLEWLADALHRLRERLSLGGRFPLAAVTLALGLVVAGTMAYGIRGALPHPLMPEPAAVRDASEWLKRQGLESRPIVAANVYFYYFHPRPVGPGHYWWIVPSLESLEKGTVAVWDRHYSDRWGLRLADLSDAGHGWHRLGSFGPDEFVILFEKTQ
jgi:hypothetical protein